MILYLIDSYIIIKLFDEIFRRKETKARINWVTVRKVWSKFVVWALVTRVRVSCGFFGPREWIVHRSRVFCQSYRFEARQPRENKTPENGKQCFELVALICLDLILSRWEKFQIFDVIQKFKLNFLKMKSTKSMISWIDWNSCINLVTIFSLKSSSWFWLSLKLFRPKWSNRPILVW